MTTVEAPDRECCWTTGYALAHCVGFDVVAGDRRLGYVEAVVLSPSGAVDALVVRGAGTVVELPADAVVEVRPHGELLRVRPGVGSYDLAAG